VTDGKAQGQVTLIDLLTRGITTQFLLAASGFTSDEDEDFLFIGFREP
jgi:hypothetical protein